MVLRESTFVVGGLLVIALGVAFIAGLIWAGAGIDYFEAWLGAGITIGLGAFFVYVGRAEAEDRRRNPAWVETEVVPEPRTRP
jgi:hypothetical protein